MKKILVVEDEQDIREDILKMLGYEGFEAIGAENGRAGVLLARQQHPDLIICDIIMPGLNGYQVLSILRGIPATMTIPFIFLTAKATRDDMRKGMRLGADDYLSKPFTISELLAAIQARLERQKTMSNQLDDLRLSLGVIMPSEIRNALTGILGFADFLKTPEMLPSLGEVAEIGKVIFESGEQLQRLVENYLIYTELKILQYKHEDSSAWLSKELIEAEEFIAFFSRYKSKRCHRAHDLSLQLDRATISFSSKTLQKILIELLDNAFKFSEPGQGVRVVSTINEQEFSLHVFDEGRGMTQEQILHIERFTYFEENWYEQQQGSGMGLIIAQLLAGICGGKLTIVSKSGVGTKVTVSFRHSHKEEHDGITQPKDRVSR